MGFSAHPLPSLLIVNWDPELVQHLLPRLLYSAPNGQGVSISLSLYPDLLFFFWGETGGENNMWSPSLRPRRDQEARTLLWTCLDFQKICCLRWARYVMEKGTWTWKWLSCHLLLPSVAYFRRVRVVIGSPTCQPSRTALPREGWILGLTRRRSSWCQRSWRDRSFLIRYYLWRKRCR